MNFKSKIAASIALLASLATTPLYAQTADFHVVPLPKEVKATQGGNFELSARTCITYPKGDKNLKRNAEYLAAFIKEATGLQLPVTSIPVQRGCIRLTATLKDNNPEAYNIRVNSDIILLDGATAAGNFYAVQTLRKALPQGNTTSVTPFFIQMHDRQTLLVLGCTCYFCQINSFTQFVATPTANFYSINSYPENAMQISYFHYFLVHFLHKGNLSDSISGCTFRSPARNRVDRERQ